MTAPYWKWSHLMSIPDDSDIESLKARIDALETAVLGLLRIHSGREFERLEAADLSEPIETARASGRFLAED
jgi:hypothetical protein